MPVGDNGQYIAPTFVNNNAPALDADEMNGMAGAAAGAVEYDREQFLSATQKTRGRMNISAAAQADVTALQQTVQQLGSQFTFKGATTSALLPQTGNVVNDTYFVTDLGYNETWNGTEWKQSGSPITVDSNLETAGYAADAQKTGNAIADQYSTTSSYDIGDIVLHSGTLYKCITAIPVAEAWNAAHWQTVNIGGIANELNSSLDGKLGVSDYSAAAAVGTADNLIDRKATATEQEWLGLRTSCGDVSISDDGTARIYAIYGNTVDGVNMTVDAIETVGFNLFNKADYEGETVTYDGRTCIEYAGSAAWTKLVSDGAYLGLVQIEVGAYIYRRGYAPNAVFEYSDGTTEVVLPRNGNETPDSWGQFYFLSNPEKNVTAVKFKNNNTTSTTNRSYADLDSICIHYVWSGYRNGEFEEYWKRVLELPISTYFPNGMMSTETVRDELRADKAIQRCELSGGVVVALAEPVETPIDPPLNLVYKVSDFGTENAKSSGTSAPFIADIAYNSDFTRMIVNNSDHIGTLSNLQTTAKNNLVAAINELAARLATLEGGA